MGLGLKFSSCPRVWLLGNPGPAVWLEATRFDIVTSIFVPCALPRNVGLKAPVLRSSMAGQGM